MIAYFFLGICLLVGFLLLARWFVSVEPRRVVSALRWVAAGLGLLVGGFLLWGGREALAAMALPMLIPLLMRYRALWNRIKAAQGPRAGQTSRIDTRFLHMVLDHDTGEMTGEVRDGRFRGRSLDELSLEEQIVLWGECKTADAQSTAVLEAYLDRARGPDWRDAAGAGPAGDGGAGQHGPAGAGAMTREEAFEILGLQAGASTEDIREAHRRLMQKLHPDHGGSNYLAAKINQAKDLLLRQ